MRTPEPPAFAGAKPRLRAGGRNVGAPAFAKPAPAGEGRSASRRRLGASALVAGLAVVALAPADAAAAEIAGRPLVIDGDSLELGGRRIRLYGIDAPELDQTCARPDREIPCGENARTALLDLLDGVDIVCLPVAEIVQGEAVAVCFADGADLGRDMVQSGWALVDRRRSTAYVAVEDAARAAARGLWRGEFVPPWEWRGARPSAGGDAALTLEIEGTAGTTFTGTCDLIADGGIEQVRLEGVIPETHRLDGTGLTCRLRKSDQDGTMIVRIRKRGGSTTTSATAGRNATVAISVR